MDQIFSLVLGQYVAGKKCLHFVSAQRLVELLQNWSCSSDIQAGVLNRFARRQYWEKHLLNLRRIDVGCIPERSVKETNFISLGA